MTAKISLPPESDAEIYDYMKERAEGGYRKYTPPAIPVELYKRCCDELVEASGADFMFHTTAIDAVRDGERIDSVVCAAKGIFSPRAPRCISTAPATVSFRQ